MSRNLTQIDGITAAIAEELLDRGIETIDQLTNSDPEDVSEIAGVSILIAENWIAKANRFSDNLLEEKEEPLVPPEEKMTSGYSMKTTTKRDIEENKESENL